MKVERIPAPLTIVRLKIFSSLLFPEPSVIVMFNSYVPSGNPPGTGNIIGKSELLLICIGPFVAQGYPVLFRRIKVRLTGYSLLVKLIVMLRGLAFTVIGE